MPRPLTALALALTLALAACGKGSSGNQAVPKQPSDPRTAATATIPPMLPSPIPAVSVVAATSGPAGVGQAGAEATPSGETESYTVKAGDTLGGIAAKLGIPLTAIEAANPDVQPADLRVGQQLNLPAAAAASPAATPSEGSPTAVAIASATPFAVPTAATPNASAASQTYTVRSGDTACKIAAAHDVSLQELAEANGKSPAGLASLRVGQTLKLPPPTGSPPGC